MRINLGPNWGLYVQMGTMSVICLMSAIFYGREKRKRESLQELVNKLTREKLDKSDQTKN